MSPQPDSKWFLRAPSADAEVRLFCLPFAGVGASAFRAWPSRHGAIEVLPVQLPGRENRSREAPEGCLGKLAERTAHALLPHLDRPFALFGHCMGGLLAWATARLLRAKGKLPRHLFLSAVRAPHMDCSGSLHSRLPEEELIAAIRDVSPALRDPELCAILAPVATRLLRWDLAMCEAYAAPLEDLGCPITTFAWTSDSVVPPRELSAWAEQVPVDQHVLAGDHYAVQQTWRPLLAQIACGLGTEGSARHA